MHLQIVNFNLKDMSHEAYLDFCTAVAPQFANIPGMISKTWLSDQEQNIYGGIYLWESALAMQNFAQSELFKNVVSNPCLANISSRDFDVLEGPSRVTHNTDVLAAFA